jgi:hypothetical protein
MTTMTTQKKTNARQMPQGFEQGATEHVAFVTIFFQVGAEQFGDEGHGRSLAPSVGKADVNFRKLVMWIISSRSIVRYFSPGSRASKSNSKLLRHIAKGGDAQNS